MSPARLHPGRQPPGRPRVLLALLALLGTGTPSALAQVDESALKAAFVYNIVAFASWSGEGEGIDSTIDPDALVICTDANKSLDAAVALLGGRSIGRRRITVHPASAQAACNVLVHAGRTHPPYPSMANALVICDGCDLPDGTTAVALVREGSRIRFDVDPASAAKAGVGFSSQLLRLARRVM
jgi:hypothetical protein